MHNKRTCMTVQVLFYTQRCIIQKLAANAAHTPRSEQGKNFSCPILSNKLSGHFVDSQVQTRNFSGSSILVKNSLMGCFCNDRSSVHQSCLCSFLIICNDCSFHFLCGSLYTCLDRFVSFHLLAVHKNPLLCGFDISQDLHLL